MTDATFTFRLEQSLKDMFAAVAEAQDLSAAQLLRRMIGDEVARCQEASAHERWLRREIEDAMGCPGQMLASPFANEAIEERWRRERDEISARGQP